MGFYSGRDFRFLMEEDEGLEDGVVVDMDDGYSQDLQKIEDNVEPFNVEDVAAAQTGHPNDDEGFDPVEESWQVCYETQYNFNQIMKAIALTECNNAYRGIMTESWDDVKGFFKRMKELFVGLVKKVAAIVKNWIDNMTTVLRSNKSFWAKYGSKLGDGLAAIQKTDKKMKGYDFKPAIITAGMKKDVGDAMKDEINKNFGVNFSTGKVDETKVKTGGGYQTAMKGIYQRIGNKFIEGTKVGLIQKNMDNAEDVRKEVKRAFYGGELEKKEMWMPVDSIKAILTKGSDIISKAKDAYKDFEKDINKTISAINRFEKTVAKDGGNDDKKDDAPVNHGEGYSKSDRLNQIRQGINACKDGSLFMQTCNSTWLTAMRTYAHQARAYANAYVFALNKGDRNAKIDKINGKSPANESGLLAGIQFI